MIGDQMRSCRRCCKEAAGPEARICFDDRLGQGQSYRCAAQPLLRQLGEIGVPALVLLVAQRVQIIPGEDAGIVEIVEGDADRIVADRLDLQDRDVALARHGHALLGRMALHFGRWRDHAQHFGRQLERLMAGEGHRQQLAVLRDPEFLRRRHGHSFAASSCPFPTPLRVAGKGRFGLPTRSVGGVDMSAQDRNFLSRDATRRNTTLITAPDRIDIAIYNEAVREPRETHQHGHDRSFRSHDQLSARFGHRPLRFPLHLLHGRGHGLPAQEGSAVAGRTRPALHGLHREGRAQAPADRRRAAGAQEHHASGAPDFAPSRKRRAGRTDADHQRLAAFALCRRTRRLRRQAHQRLARHAGPGKIPRRSPAGAISTRSWKASTPRRPPA